MNDVVKSYREKTVLKTFKLELEYQIIVSAVKFRKSFANFIIADGLAYKVFELTVNYEC